MNAEQSFIDAFNATVSSSQLRLGTTKSFSTDQPIQLTVTVPNFSSLYVPTAAHVYVEGGAMTPVFNVSHTGTGELALVNVNATGLSILTTGCALRIDIVLHFDHHLHNSVAKIVANGSIDDAYVQSTGTGDVYLDGVEGTVQTILTGTGNLYVQGNGGVLGVLYV